MRILFLLPLLLLSSGCQKKPEPQKPTFQVIITKPLVQTVNLYNAYIGNVHPFLQVEIKAQVEGVLTGAFFKEGDEVKEGDLIFSIDSRPYVAQLQKAEGALAQSLANLRYAEDVAKRNARLAQEDYVSQVQYDEYITNVLTSKASIKENEADITTAKINISYCNIHAPMNSITGKIGLQVGNLIPNVGETPLVTLNQITPTYTYFSVPQKDLPQIMELHREKKLEVRAFLNGDYENPYTGTLDLIDNEVNTETGSILMRGIFQNEEKKLWPGEFIDVHLILGEQKNAILIPTEAIAQGQKGQYVFIIKENNTTELKWIKPGQRIGKMTIINKGVKPGDQVVLQGQVNLGTGTKVSIKNTVKGSI
ncbi:MAG: Multidrug resistance protein MdtA [Chlamydiae bacterium]|nr:Multidrug resistance protein MdtA [Chlamydiota bacterium]